MASDLLLTPKERARRDKVREMLAKGENPYNKEGSDRGPDPVPHQSERFIRELDPEEIRKIEDKWKAGVDGKVIDEKVYLDPEMFPDLMGGPEKDPSKLYCSYCGSETDIIRATVASKKPRKVRKDELFIRNGILTVEERIFHVSDKVIACPKCCLAITSGIKFPETDG